MSHNEWKQSYTNYTENKSQMTKTKINEIELTLLCSVNHINTKMILKSVFIQ